jgi:hypothetical protein
VKRLLERHRPNVGAKDGAGRTAYQIAAQEGYKEIEALLVGAPNEGSHPYPYRGNSTFHYSLRQHRSLPWLTLGPGGTQGGDSSQLLGHIRAFLDHRERIDALWRRVGKGLVTGIRSLSGELPQQRTTGGRTVVSSVEELYEAAAVGLGELEALLTECVAVLPDAHLSVAPLKQRERAMEKARGQWGGACKEVRARHRAMCRWRVG